MDIGFKVKGKNPKENVNCLSTLFFGWMIKVVRQGTKQGLEITDLYKPLDKNKSKKLGDSLELHWKNEIYRAEKQKTDPSFLRALWNTFKLKFILYGFFWFLYSMLGCFPPIILLRLIRLYDDPFTDETQLDFYITTALLLTVLLVLIFLTHHSMFGLAAIGMRIRIATSALVYRKITRLSQKALTQTAVGQVINLLSNDVSRFDLAMVPFHSSWTMPFNVLFLSYFIWQQVGISSLAGLAFLVIISLPVQGYFAKLIGKFRSSISKKTDRRVKLMSEIISGIQVIKMYAWEKPFEKLVKSVRMEEIKDITATSYIRGFFASSSIFLEKSSLFLTIMCFVLLGNTITAAIVFSLAQSYNILQLHMAIYFPMAISLNAEALVSVKRLQEFLLLEERHDSSIEYIKQNGIHLVNVNASWTNRWRTLQDVVLHIPPGTLCAVVGPVGAGKSSFIQLLLGELPLTSGTIQIGKNISYCSQNPWLFQSSIRNNILFGQRYNKTWYKTVVKVCALERDLEQFPQGDQTLVGERGVLMSGGQKARINLARALYRNADIYLLDDPLSAVDAQVGKQLFDECIKKQMKGKTRLLVTHQLQYLKEANLIVVINEGVIEAQGTYEELSNSNLDFTKLLMQHEQSPENPEEKEQVFSSSNLSRSLLQSSFISSDISQSVDINPHYEEGEGDEEVRDSNSKPLKNYLLATESKFLLVVVFLLLILGQIVCTCTDLWVTFWTTEERIRHLNDSVILESESMEPAEDVTIHTMDHPVKILLHTYEYTTWNDTFLNSFKHVVIRKIFDHIHVDQQDYTVIKTDCALYFYGALVGATVVLTLLRSLTFFKMCMRSSVNLHTRIFHTLLQAPMKFFNTNPSGRILNRFSKDMGAVDEILPRELLDAIQIFLVMCGIFVTVAISNPYFIIAIIVLSVLFLRMRSWYQSTATALKHLETITKSPLYSQVNSTFTGIATIRSSQTEDILIEEFDDNQDVHTSAWYLLIACIYSFGVWLDMLCWLLVLVVSCSFIFLHKYTMVNGSMVGLALVQSIILTGMLQYGMRQMAEVINQFISVERILQYTKIDTEGPFETPKELIPKGPWPEYGGINFEKVSLKYAEDDPPVLKDLNFSIKPGEKIGIVGRTGAGKTSLISLLFRLAPNEGSIYIDDTDTKVLGLNDLRKKISIIPQEPVLFSSTLRYNLDPFNEYHDDQIWKALEEVDLKDSIDSLDYIVAEGGTNFSLGQRQLICLARAALRNNKILVLDEATANVDARTDLFIQSKIREKFSDCTVLTIAHRINTIMDSDRVLVMDFGRVVEFDQPLKLLEIPDGYFNKLVMEGESKVAFQVEELTETYYILNGE